jgi:hypothetical protein
MRHTERRRGGERLAPPIRVLAAGVLVRDAGVDHHELGRGRPRDPLEGDGPGVDEQRLAWLAEAAGHLVHDPHRRADEVGLDAMRQPRDGVIVDRQAIERAQPAQQADAQRRRRRHAAADRNRRGDPHVEPGDFDAVIAQDARDALDVVDPSVPGLLVADHVGGGVATERGAVGAHAAAGAARSQTWVRCGRIVGSTKPWW